MLRRLFLCILRDAQDEGGGRILCEDLRILRADLRVVFRLGYGASERPESDRLRAVSLERPWA